MHYYFFLFYAIEYGNDPIYFVNATSITNKIKWKMEVKTYSIKILSDCIEKKDTQRRRTESVLIEIRSYLLLLCEAITANLLDYY